MSEEDFNKAVIEWGFDINFKTKKDRLYYMYCIASIYHKKIEIIKTSKKKCYRKVMSGQGMETSKWATMRNYNDELKHHNGKYEIISAEIV